MNISLRLLPLVLLLLLFSSCGGQNTGSTADAASKRATNASVIFQDSKNNYWFGSFGQGVTRYDGKTLTRFTIKDGLSNDTIRQIEEDQAGNILFATHGGICKFDGEKIIKLKADKTDISAWRSEPGDLWFTGEPGKNGPYRYDGKTLYSLEFPKHYMENEMPAGLPSQRYSPYETYFIYKDKIGNTWFGTSNFGICLFDGKNLRWMYEEHLTLIPGGGSFGIRSIIEDKEGKFWFCNTRYRYDILPGDSIGKDHHFINYKREKGFELKTPNGDDQVYYMSATTDNDGKLWMATYRQGIWCYDGEKVKHYSVKDEKKEITVYSIYKDRKGDLWLGTHESGPYKFNGKAFEKVIL